MSDSGEGRALAFLKNVLQEKQIDNETYLWSLADDVSLLGCQISVGFYLPRAEFYRETAQTYDGSIAGFVFCG
jgi:hypothetical protein